MILSFLNHLVCHRIWLQFLSLDQDSPVSMNYSLSYRIDNMGFFERLNNVLVYHINNLVAKYILFPSYFSLYKELGGKGESYVDLFKKGMVLEQSAFGLDYVRPIPPQVIAT